MAVRLQKFLAEAGVASRRASEQLVTAGRVTINGRVVRELGTKVDPIQDRVTVDGQPVKTKRKLYLALNKPAGFVCSRRDPQGRSTVYELLPKEWQNVYTVGRLDYDTEGLIFLTNDGDFAFRATHPRFQVRKKYLILIEGRISADLVQRLTQGVVHSGERLKADRVRVLKSGSHQSLIELELSEGKNREVRRMFEAIGSNVVHLRRVQIGPIKLGELPVGKWRTISEAEMKSFGERPSKHPVSPPPKA